MTIRSLRSTSLRNFQSLKSAAAKFSRDYQMEQHSQHGSVAVFLLTGKPLTKEATLSTPSASTLGQTGGRSPRVVAGVFVAGSVIERGTDRWSALKLIVR